MFVSIVRKRSGEYAAFFTMKYIHNALMLVLAAGICGLQPLLAEDEAADVTGKKKEADTEEVSKSGRKSAKAEAAQVSKVAKALKKMKSFNGKPNAKARYFIYLSSASWCGPCNREMPKVVEAHKAMKEDGRIDIVLIGRDHSVDDAKKYLKRYKAKFSGVMSDDRKIDKLPGYSAPSGIPFCTFVNSDGKVLYVGHASAISRWKEMIDKADAELQKEEEASEEAED